MIEQLHLPLANEEVITVHCFFTTWGGIHTCSHVVRSEDPQMAHDLMEQHYAEKHMQQINRVVAHYNSWAKG